MATATCGTHGEREARYVCDHLFQNARARRPRRLAYFEPHHEPDEPTPAVWCAQCEAVVQAEGAVNAKVDAFARFHLVCDFCFVRYLEGNDPAPDGA